MNFKELYERISPKLRRLARARSAHRALLGEDDLYQEACLHLWNNFREGMPEGVNESYIVKSCEFHILNYLRKKRGRFKVLNLDEPINEGGDTLGDLLPDNKARGEEHIDRAITIDDIRNNGFSDREKQVFSLLIKGCTVREAGRALGISHVMVVRARKSIISKWRREENK
ncbi:MAG: sigma-70 family RNA polymerase sigma factor [Candidatus Omnitrophica bacterium]|nr:sigma-70 family RNA polymerase sigma factor [Candidatus Omnitrophota bacterium]